MRPLTFQVKIPPVGKTSLELSGAKPAFPKASSAAFGEVLHPGQAHVAHPGADPRHPRDLAGRDRDDERRDDPTDPHVRHAAQLGPPPGLAQGDIVSLATILPAAGVPARASLEDLLPALVRRVAWSGDGRRGTVRLELGSGALAGAELVVHADDGRVRVQLRAPAGVDLGPLRERIALRLAARGVALDEVE
jgi:hypothetical protein